MKTIRLPALLSFVFSWVSVFCCTPTNGEEHLLLHEIKLPPGFKIDIYAENVEGARSMALGKQGTLFVGTRKAGKVYAVIDRN
jgi:hypothetical protein